MISINVALDPQLDGPKDSKVCSLISHVMECEGISHADLSLIFGNDNLLADLKKKFFDLDHFTDVIAFRLNEYDQPFIEGEL